MAKLYIEPTTLKEALRVIKRLEKKNKSLIEKNKELKEELREIYKDPYYLY